MRSQATCIAFAIWYLYPALAIAQSDVDPVSRFAWSENIGWTNWRDAGTPAGAEGVRVHDTFLSGMIWAENAGWINLGDGAPANGIAYANVDGADSGVNRDAESGSLSGLAWGENVGWINLAGGALATPPAPARIEDGLQGCRFAGYAWSENIGWINLDDAVHFVGLVASVCDTGLPGDLNCDGLINGRDVSPFVLAVTNPTAYVQTYSNCRILNGDLNDDGLVNAGDIASFVAMLTGA